MSRTLLLSLLMACSATAGQPSSPRLLEPQAESTDIEDGLDLWIGLPGITEDQKRQIERIFAETGRQYRDSASAVAESGPLPLWGDSSTPRTELAAFAARATLKRARNMQVPSVLTQSQWKPAEEKWQGRTQALHIDGLAKFGRGQATSSLCWASALQTIYRFLGVDVTQRELEQFVFGSSPNKGVEIRRIVERMSTFPRNREVAALGPGGRMAYAVDEKVPPEIDQMIVFTMGQAFMLPALDNEHLILLTGIEWSGLRNPHIQRIRYFDPATGTEHTATGAEWERIRRSISGMIRIGFAGFFGAPKQAPDSSVSLPIIRKGRTSLVTPRNEPIRTDELDEITSLGWMTPARRGKGWGYVGMDGRFKIKPDFDEVTLFSWATGHENVAAVREGTQWQYIDRQGHPVFSSRWKAATPFSNDRAAVSREGIKWGYIDQTGKLMIPTIYDEAWPFAAQYSGPGEVSHLVAAVRTNKRWKLIDGKGNSIKEISYDSVVGFGGEPVLGSGIITVQRDGRYSFVDYEGNPLPGPDYAEAGVFSMNAVPARRERDEPFGYFDVHDDELVKPTFDWAGPMTLYGAVVEQDGLIGFINPPGDRTTAPDYSITPRYSGFLGMVTGYPLIVDAFGMSWYVDRHGRKFLSHSDEPISTGVRGKRLIQVDVASEPDRARVYFIPRLVWQKQEDELRKTEAARSEWETPKTFTNMKVKVYDQVWIVLFVWEDAMKAKKVSVDASVDKIFEAKE